jgi:hypothetical protein
MMAIKTLADEGIQCWKIVPTEDPENQDKEQF